ncbi:HWE histidine kinase domain-containing protein [Methylobacterium pseudosasicola]|uniref:Blue-light-activated histidine kinase n=1 Tax=Methylobacterium pseudosasicola TaxID=582667 RepID=A0A1I4K9Z3_9HYPH|nr:HWE histidine kinase domain-containing protein [Methylobacterium pseudosasicola]SFL75652.1 PAS domain S-box-containing protein [Methylobacterium pseudosasicola]
MHGSPDPPNRDVDAAFLRAAVEATGEAILVTSADLAEPGPLIEYANPAFTRMSGYTAEDVIGRSPRLLQGPLTDRLALDRMRTALMAGEPFQGEALNYRKDGTTYAVEWLITPVLDGNGQIAHWVSAQREVTERREALEHQKLLVRELHHRVKNTLATVQAIMSSTARGSVTMPEFQQAFGGRIASLAKTHTLLTEDRFQSVPFRNLLWAELEPYDDGGQTRIRLEGPEVVLASEFAVPIGMAVHELTTNAAKHGALAEFGGRIEVTWSLDETPDGPRLIWVWNEQDGPPVALPSREGFGSRLLKRVLSAQVHAEVDIDYDPDGLRVTVSLPLSSPY